ncbi:hypothetical protein J4Q44_G00117530 [Coregonus suidteri]|uniref:Secreted protein n=1 Tax=Coregonus suidteri TaxID=861788 RepID=A0AAN8M3Z5_9TELE
MYFSPLIHHLFTLLMHIQWPDCVRTMSNSEHNAHPAILAGLNLMRGQCDFRASRPNAAWSDRMTEVAFKCQGQSRNGTARQQNMTNAELWETTSSMPLVEPGVVFTTPPHLKLA